MNNQRKYILIGFAIAVIVNTMGSIIYTYIISKFSLLTTWEYAYKNGTLNSIIVLGALPNIALFFIFLKKNRDLKAKGVLLASILTAVVTLTLKFL